MATTISAVNSPSIRHAEFVRLTMPSETLTYCNAAAPIIVNGITFDGLGSFMQLGSINTNIKASNTDLTVGLTGIDPANIAIALSSEIKGSVIEVWRGFLDSNNQIITTPTQQFFKRYQGIINNMNIAETFDDNLRSRVATIIVSCSSFRMILQNRIAGIKTNTTDWKALYPNDTSMNRVSAIVAQYFDFGKPPMTGSQSTATGTEYTNPLNYTGNGINNPFDYNSGS